MRIIKLGNKGVLTEFKIECPSCGTIFMASKLEMERNFDDESKFFVKCPLCDVYVNYTDFSEK